MLWEFIVIAGVCYLTHVLLLNYRIRRQKKEILEDMVANDNIEYLKAVLENRGYKIHREEQSIEIKNAPDSVLPLQVYTFATSCIPLFDDADSLLNALEVMTKQYGSVVFKEHPDDSSELSLGYNSQKQNFECVYSSSHNDPWLTRTNEWLNRDETLTFLDKVINKYKKEYA